MAPVAGPPPASGTRSSPDPDVMACTGNRAGHHGRIGRSSPEPIPLGSTGDRTNQGEGSRRRTRSSVERANSAPYVPKQDPVRSAPGQNPFLGGALSNNHERRMVRAIRGGSRTPQNDETDASSWATVPTSVRTPARGDISGLLVATFRRNAEASISRIHEVARIDAAPHGGQVDGMAIDIPSDGMGQPCSHQHGP